MAITACPGCGLPGEDDCSAAVPCPICSAGVSAEPVDIKLAIRAEFDPTADLPADASQMEAFATHPTGRRLSRIVMLGAFLFGIGTGAGGLLAWQRTRPHVAGVHHPPVAISSTAHPHVVTAIAPMPHLLSPQTSGTAQNSIGDPGDEAAARLKGFESPAEVAPIAERVVISLNQPDAAFTLHRPINRGECLILRGKVRMLRVNGLEPGATLDASGLEVGSVYWMGRSRVVRFSESAVLGEWSRCRRR